MTLCKFHQQGSCKFGNSCRFEHPRADNRGQPQNRFSALAAAGGGGENAALEDALSTYSKVVETILKDLTTETPQWILSAYAPGRDDPEQLFGGFPREQSFEEMRLHYLTARASANEQQALDQARELYQNAQLQMQTVLGNVQDAARFVVEAENKHPNRLDVCREGTQGHPFGQFLIERRRAPIATPGQAANPFGPASGGATNPFGGAATQPGPGAFGQPSALGQRPAPFGTPAFGQPAQPQAAPFGQPSRSTGSAFGQSAQTTSTFGQPSGLGAKPNPFAAPAFGQPAQPAVPAGGSAFGQVGQLGGAKPNPFASGGAASGFASASNSNAAAPAANPFAGADSAPPNATSNPFASHALANQNGSGASLSGQQQTQSTGPFCQMGGRPAKPNPFATGTPSEPEQSSNPFAQNTQDQTNGGAFGAPGNNASVLFGQPAIPQQQNPFAAGGQPQQAPGAGAAPTQGSTSPYPPGSTKQHPAVRSYTRKNPDGSLASFKGKPVVYKGSLPGIRAPDGTWTRIWFPAGAPGYYKDTESSPEEHHQRSSSQWAVFAQTGRFEGDVMPGVPPPRECLLWDF